MSIPKKNKKNPIFGANLKKLREMSGLTQPQFIVIVGIPNQPSLSRYEAGRVPDDQLLKRISDHFGISVDDLLYRSLTDSEADQITKAAASRLASETIASIKTTVIPKTNARRVISAISADSREIPVVNWVAAGKRSYPDFMRHVQDRVMARTRDQDAFGVVIEGDSMEPRYLKGDIAVVEPNMAPQSGGLVVARFKNEDQVFKGFEWVKFEKRCRLKSKNPNWPPTEHDMDEFEFIYPVKEVIAGARF